MKKNLLLAILIFALISNVSAQSTTITLPTTDNTSNFNVTNGSATLFNLKGDAGFYIGGTYGTGVQPVTGAGTRLMWYPKKAAFRAGIVDGTQWDDTNIGDYSFASGSNTTASGEYSTAMGYQATASKKASTAIGYFTTANEDLSTAMGYMTTASGVASTAMGGETTASGIGSTAIGYLTTASGYFSTAIGYNSTATGDYSTSMGNYVSTDIYEGSFIIGDNSASTTYSLTANNCFAARFANGYYLYTDSDCSVGVSLAASGNSWSTISDSTKKYAFLPVNGESVLNKIGKFNLRTWSYKGQDSTKFRHYGPMAQEFFNAFGRDEYGVAGCDTTINHADFTGVNLIAIQALIKRTEKQNSELKSENSAMKTEIAKQNEIITWLQKNFEAMQKQIAALTKDSAAKLASK